MNKFGYIGDNMRDIILAERAKISIYQRILKKRKNKKGERMSNAGYKKMKREINMTYERIKNMRDELHHKAALYLCRNYDIILISEFRIQPMISEKDIRIGKKKVKAVYKEEGKEAGKAVLKEYKRKKRLNKKVKYVLQMLSHYRFRQHLINKANEYGNKIDRDVNGSRNILIENIGEYIVKEEEQQVK